MKKYICLKLSAWLILLFSLLVTKNAFSQVAQDNNNAALGSGSGKAGAFVSLLLAIAGLALGCLALRSSHKNDVEKECV
jgi:Family of unknown function (DUF6223)